MCWFFHSKWFTAFVQNSMYSLFFNKVIALVKVLAVVVSNNFKPLLTTSVTPKVGYVVAAVLDII